MDPPEASRIGEITYSADRGDGLHPACQAVSVVSFVLGDCGAFQAASTGETWAGPTGIFAL